MVDRDSRNRLAQALRHYVSGRMTNDELDDVIVNWEDRGAVAVKEMSWQLYDDMSTHKATGRHHLDKSARREISRWIVFLYSDREYVWPEYSFIQIFNWPLNLLTIGWWERMKRRKWQKFAESGDSSVWPFFCKQEFKQAIRHPKLLSGHASAPPSPPES